MAQSGQVVQGKYTTITFLETAAESHGKRLRFKQEVQPGAPETPGHFHLKQVEHFKVLSGTMGVQVEGIEQILSAGETISVPIGVPHAMWNAGDDVLVQEIALEPALRSETFFETVTGLECDGLIPDGKPTFKQLLQVSLLFPFYGNALADVPLLAQKILFTVLALPARLVGLRAWYPRHSPHGISELFTESNDA
ncbi:MAG: cupin domain-containing protein [Deinococcota bacterium]